MLMPFCRCLLRQICRFENPPSFAGRTRSFN
jgi:hypothetical protein